MIKTLRRERGHQKQGKHQEDAQTHQREAERLKSSAIHKPAGRLPYLLSPRLMPLPPADELHRSATQLHTRRSAHRFSLPRYEHADLS
jgi:hypothetical protein